MNKIIKIVSIILNVSVILVAIGTVGYFWGYQKLEANLIQKGFNIAIGQIIQSVQQTGQVQIGDIILIQKK